MIFHCGSCILSDSLAIFEQISIHMNFLISWYVIDKTDLLMNQFFFNLYGFKICIKHIANLSPAEK